MAESPRSIDGLGFDEPKALVIELLEEGADLKAEIEALREEIVRLKGLNGRPKHKLSGMHQETQARAKSGDRKQRRRPKNSQLVIDEDKVLEAEGVPDGSRFKGTQHYEVRMMTRV